jgi:hypothetical protein
VQVGLRKLLDAEGEVNIMKQELIALQPKLIETGVRDALAVQGMTGDLPASWQHVAS